MSANQERSAATVTQNARSRCLTGIMMPRVVCRSCVVMSRIVARGASDCQALISVVAYGETIP